MRNKHLLLIKNKAEEMLNFVIDNIKSQSKNKIIKTIPIYPYYHFEYYSDPKDNKYYDSFEKYLFEGEADEEDFAIILEENILNINKIHISFYLKFFNNRTNYDILNEHDIKIEEYLEKDFFDDLFKKAIHFLNENNNSIQDNVINEETILIDLNFAFEHKEPIKEGDMMIESSFINFHAYLDLYDIF